LTIKPIPELSKQGIPTIFEVIKDGKHLAPGVTAEEATAFFNMLMGVRVMGRPFAVAAGVPADRVKALRAAFVTTAKDPKFQAEAKKLKRDVDLVTGEEIQAIVEKMAATPKPVLTKLDDMLKFKGPTQTAKIEMSKHTGKLAKIVDGGRRIVVNANGKDVTAGISGSRTKITVGGKAAKRSAFKEGMTCTVTAAPGSKEAANVDCK
jgi:hypothetical protein